MHKSHLYKVLLPALLLLPAVSFAQNGSVPQDVATSSIASTTTGNATPAALATTSKATSTPASVATTTKPKSATTTPAVATSTSTTTPIIPVDDEGNLLVRTVFVLLVVIPFGFLAVQYLNRKKTSAESKDTSHNNTPDCFNIKQMLDKKLQEITDLKGRVEGRMQDISRDKISSSLKGTKGGEALALLIQAEKQYAKLKKIYEECTIEFEKNAYKGIIVSQSLSDDKVLEKLEIKKTYKVGDWVLNNVLVSEKQIPELSAHLADGPWYIHFWKNGSDDVKVIFKNKVFAIKHSDKSTWIPAVAYGKSIGIPEEQLDFPI